MRAIIHDRYGSYEHLRLGEIEKPIPTDEQVLVRVLASSANAGDWRRVRGAPILIRLFEGLRRPRSPLLGGDAAGIVEAVGASITHVGPGDEVFGIRTGAFAEYVAGTSFAVKPANLSFEQAAALPIAGITALQAVRDHGAVKQGQRVLVNGAGGGVGSAAVQIAKAFGADVTAVTGPRTLDMVGSLGVDDVVDHASEDFTRRGRRFDAVIDLGGNRSVRDLRRVLAPGGRLVLVGAGKGNIGPMTRLIGGQLRTRVLRQQDVRVFVAGVERADLDQLRELVEANKLRPIIDRTYPLEETGEALRYVEDGRARGKVVIRIGAPVVEEREPGD